MNSEAFEDVWNEHENFSGVNADIFRKNFKLGYLDGTTKIKNEETLKGFEKGFITGKNLGLEIGKILTFLKIQNFKIEFEQLKKDLNFDNFFDDQINSKENKEKVIEKWKKILIPKYMNT